jgi:lysophospholipase L1-like esterase
MLICCSFLFHKMTDTTFTYLALGDSYTIGESVPESLRFPVQTAHLLNNQGVNLQAPRIIARTGWTTDELDAAIQAAQVTGTYDVVTLLIGVNDQYRGRPLHDYTPNFTKLLEQAIHFAGDHPDRVVVLSIPDWGVTPFAEGRDRQAIASEIDDYNKENKRIAAHYKVHYLDITQDTRHAAGDPELFASDGLHYSGREMAIWAGKLAGILKNMLAP